MINSWKKINIKDKCFNSKNLLFLFNAKRLNENLTVSQAGLLNNSVIYVYVREHKEFEINKFEIFNKIDN